MAKTKIRSSGNRGGGGRPRMAGPRTASGRLKVEPNARVVAARAALGVGDSGARMGPIRFAYSKGWLNLDHMVIADVYLDAYSHAGLGGTGFSASKDDSAHTGAVDELRIDWSSLDNAQVAAMGWNTFTAKEVAAIWDSAFRPVEPYKGRTSALRKWKAMSAALNAAERGEVESVVLHGSWPQWVIQRNSGHMDTSWEGKREILISALVKMGRALKSLKAEAANEDQANDNGGSGSDARRPGPQAA